jgi:hypothetical protein
MTMQSAAADRPDDNQLQARLHRSLYRFDCPPPHTLGEYELDLLPPAGRGQVAAHVVDCVECRGELTTLRSFLSQPIDMPESVLGRAKRLVATLMAPVPRLAYGGLRGKAEPSVRVYEIEDVTITVGAGDGSGSLIGLVMVTSSPPEQLVGREVRLVPATGSPLVAELDDIGNFEFSSAASGEYVLELDLPDSLIVIEALRVD